MTTKKKIVWRLGKLPTPSELAELVRDKIITQEEAKEILLTEEEVDDRTTKSLEDEIKFLRELVNKLSEKSTIVHTIKEIETRYKTYPWYGPYYTYCNAVNGGGGGGITGGNKLLAGSGAGAITNADFSVVSDATPGSGSVVAAFNLNESTDFTNIKTF